MRTMIVTMALALAHGASANAETAQANPIPCEVGSYAMADGTQLDIAASEPGKLRWRRLDGSTGKLTSRHRRVRL